MPQALLPARLRSGLGRTHEVGPAVKDQKLREALWRAFAVQLSGLVRDIEEVGPVFSKLCGHGEDIRVIMMGSIHFIGSVRATSEHLQEVGAIKQGPGRIVGKARSGFIGS